MIKYIEIMSSNRLMYDSCEAKQRVKDSTEPLNYMLYPGKYENCAKCRIELGAVGGNAVSIFSGNMVDLESDLRGQSRPLSKCNANQFNPTTMKPQGSLMPLKTCQPWSYKPVVAAPKFQPESSCNY